MSDKPAKATTPAKQIGSVIQSDAFQAQLRLACVASITPERVARIALTEMQRTPKLAACKPETIYGALMEVAATGLEPGPAGLAYLIPYGDVCQFIPSYRGLLSLAFRSGDIAHVSCEVVREGDDFDFRQGTRPFLDHTPGAGGDVTHVYACVGLKSGGDVFRVMTREEVDEHRRRFSPAKSGPWETDFAEMACKTVLKRTLKRCPISTELARAVEVDNQAEAWAMAVDVPGVTAASRAQDAARALSGPSERPNPAEPKG